MYIKNTTQGPKSVNTTSGTATLEPGEARDDIELSAAELTSAEGTGWFAFARVEVSAGTAVPPDAVIADLMARNAELEAENASLKGRLETALADRAPGAGDQGERLYEARDTGSGWWTIFDQDENEVGKKIRRDDAEAFNAKTDEEKAAFVAEHTVDQD